MHRSFTYSFMCVQFHDNAYLEACAQRYLPLDCHFEPMFIFKPFCSLPPQIPT
ncbi:hypothetical protein RchiOBHm_Chr7g0196221 [Rosa chinensis]|uniref:Uncharacterized protein n=1 Tax=Rosa chinensis TaxID=74649 RepID=A0A2P6P6K4_ROSCH|nr:hypothetical protein RchiOBHm_Chr7g0196221 [Rosa chinensis]